MELGPRTIGKHAENKVDSKLKNENWEILVLLTLALLKH